MLHLFLGEQVPDIATVKSLIRKVASNYHLPYFTLTPTFSVCTEHGYLNGEQPKCIYCNRETEIYSRVVGYLRPVKQWNDGKQAEYALRKTFRLETLDKGLGAAAAGAQSQVSPLEKAGLAGRDKAEADQLSNPSRASLG